MSAAKTDRALSLQSHRRVKTRNHNQKPILLRQDTEEGKEKKAGRKRYAFTKPPCIQLPPHNRPLATTVANPVPASSDLPSPPRRRQNKEDRVHDEVPPQIFLRHIIIIITFVFFCIPQNSCHFHFFFFFVVVVFFVFRCFLSVIAIVVAERSISLLLLQILQLQSFLDPE